MKVPCIYCGAAIPPEAQTCVRCGAPPPEAFFDDDERTWGQFSIALEAMSTWYREPPEPLSITQYANFLIVRLTDRHCLPAHSNTLRVDLPRGNILTYLAVRPSKSFSGRFRLIVNGSINVVHLPIVTFPVSFNLNLQTPLHSYVEAEIEGATETDVQFDFFRRELVSIAP